MHERAQLRPETPLVLRVDRGNQSKTVLHLAEQLQINHVVEIRALEPFEEPSIIWGGVVFYGLDGVTRLMAHINPREYKAYIEKLNLV